MQMHLHVPSSYSAGLEDRILVKKNGLAPRFEHPQIEYSRGKKQKKNTTDRILPRIPDKKLKDMVYNIYKIH